MKKVLALVVAVSIFYFLFSIFSPVLADGTGIWKDTQCAAGSDSGGPVKPCDLCDALVVVRNIINYLVEVGLAIAALLIAYGAIRLMVAGGSEEYISKGKKTMVLAVTSLAIILGAWLIVNTVLHVLVKDTKYFPWQKITCTTAAIPPEQLKEAPISTPFGISSQPPPPFGTYSHEEAFSRLAAAGIQVSSSGGCSDQLNPNCTSLWGIPRFVIDKLINIKQSCPPPPPYTSCEVVVTGGTEIGHQSHGPSLPVVDLRFNEALAKYLKDNAQTLEIKEICTTDADGAYRVNCSFPEPQRHLHVGF